MNARQIILEYGRPGRESPSFPEERREVYLGRQIKFHAQRAFSGEHVHQHLRQIDQAADELIGLHESRITDLDGRPKGTGALLSKRRLPAYLAKHLTDV